MQTMRQLINYAAVNEAIVNRPYQLPTYLRNRIKTLTVLIDRLNGARAVIKDNAVDGASMLQQGVRYGHADDEEARDLVHSLYNLEHTNLIERYRLDDLRSSLENYVQYGPEFIKYVLAALEYIRPIDDDTKRALTLLPQAEAGFLEYGWEPGNEEHEADPEYAAAKKLLQAFRVYAGALVAIDALQADLKAKMQVLTDIRASASWGKEYRPEHGATETLYHATAYVRDLVQNGFSPELPDGRRGLGNLGHQNLISFTHDLELARNIMRTLKEMWMIAHGQLTGTQILGWARTEGIEAEVTKSWSHLTGGEIPKRNADPKRVALLYRYWLAHTKLRSDPVMVSPEKTIELLVKQDIADIGVLACEVQLEKSDQYLYGESEFRVAASKVISVKQVL